MKVFATDDTALATYLYLKGIKIYEGTRSNPEHRRRRFFLFEPHEKIHEHKKNFYNRTTTVVPLEFAEARTHISRFLKIDLPSSDKIK